MGGARSTYGESRGVHRVLVGKPEGKRPLGRLRCRWEDNIKMDIQEEIKSRLTSENACYNSVQSFVFQVGIQKLKD